MSQPTKYITDVGQLTAEFIPYASRDNYICATVSYNLSEDGFANSCKLLLGDFTAVQLATSDCADDAA
jgi:hypothetical protein